MRRAVLKSTSAVLVSENTTRETREEVCSTRITSGRAIHRSSKEALSLKRRTSSSLFVEARETLAVHGMRGARHGSERTTELSNGSFTQIVNYGTLPGRLESPEVARHTTSASKLIN
jgi:uncharacterized protein (UPF0548 family)